MKKGTNNKKAVLVSTQHRGVFFGYGIPSDAPTIRIERARMVVFWDSACRGFLGLAANGPTKQCRIGPQAMAITLRDVTSVVELHDAATAKFEEAPWSA